MSLRQIDSFRSGRRRSVPARSRPVPTIWPASWRASAGQATVELVGLLPLLAAVGFGVFSALAAAKAEELASSAAEAGAIALLQEHDAEEAARSALPGWSRRQAHIRVDGRRVTVRVQPRGPVDAINERLTASVTADAGPEARP